MRKPSTLAYCIALLIQSVATAGGQSRPQALENLQRQRDALQTATIEFSWQNHRDFSWPRFYTGRLANQDEIAIDRGDPDGLMRASDGSVNPAQGVPRLTLKLEEETWIYESDGMRAREEEECRLAEHIHRLRTLGASYHNSYSDLHDTLWRDRVSQPGARSYSEEVRDGLDVVTCETDYGTITWWIDPRRGWSPVRVVLRQHGEVVAESRSTLKQFGGVWYPDMVLFFSKGYKDGQEPLETVKVHAARFNKPEHPQRFTPAGIGVEAGMTVEKVNADQTIEVRVFDGTKAVSQAEFNRRYRAGEIELGPTFLRSLAQADAREAQREAARQEPAKPIERAESSSAWDGVQHLVESEWAAYTRRFVVRLKLDDEQSQKAWLILRQCQELADKHIKSHEADFERLDRPLQAAREADDAKELSALEQRRAKLMEPMNLIFEEKLKPRLDAIPTRAQRRAAGLPSERSAEEP